MEIAIDCQKYFLFKGNRSGRLTRQIIFFLLSFGSLTLLVKLFLQIISFTFTQLQQLKEYFLLLQIWVTSFLFCVAYNSTLGLKFQTHDCESFALISQLTYQSYCFCKIFTEIVISVLRIQQGKVRLPLVPFPNQSGSFTIFCIGFVSFTPNIPS